MCKIMLFFFFFLIVSGCTGNGLDLSKPTKRKISPIESEDIKDTEAPQEGDIYSKERWIRIQKKLNCVVIGMSRLGVIEKLGYPDGARYTPKNIMQYSVADGVVVGLSVKPIHIILDHEGNVSEIKKADFVYGPPPH